MGHDKGPRTLSVRRGFLTTPGPPPKWGLDTHPVHFNNEAGFSLLEAEVGVYQARAVLQHVCSELAGELGVVWSCKTLLEEVLFRGTVDAVLLGCWGVACRIYNFSSASPMLSREAVSRPIPTLSVEEIPSPQPHTVCGGGPEPPAPYFLRRRS